MNTFRNSTMAVAVAGLLAAAALPSSAADVTEVRANEITERVEIAVPYGDLDLNTAAGQETLQNRIASAARKVCGGGRYREIGDLRGASRRQDCFESSMARAMSRVSEAQVASVN
jgi:UrcA family protein